jgi:hypothetical protein
MELVGLVHSCLKLEFRVDEKFLELSTRWINSHYFIYHILWFR